MTRPVHDPFARYDPFRLHVFVPAIMSAGLLFSLVTLVRDALATRGRRRAERRTMLAAVAAVDAVLAATGTGSPVAPVAPAAERRTRWLYAGTAAACLAAATYLVPGSILNYRRAGGYVAGIAWLLCVSLLVGGALLVVGASSALVAVDWPRPRPAVRWLPRIVAFPASGPQAGGTTAVPSPWLDGALLAAVAALTFVVLGVGTGRFRPFDASVSDSIRSLKLPVFLRAIAGLGSTPTSLVLATAIGAIAVRCRTFAWAWIGTVLGTFAVDAVLKALVERERPPFGALAGREDSFPSGHLAQLLLLAVVAPLALRVVTDRRWSRIVAATVLVAAAVIAALQRVDVASHWPTDVIGGALLGLTAGLGMRWAVEHGRWHRSCPGCPWRPEEEAGR